MFPIIFFSEATNITKGTLCVPRNSYVGDLLLMSCYLLPLKFSQVMRIGTRVVIHRARLLCYKSKLHQYFVNSDWLGITGHLHKNRSSLGYWIGLKHTVRLGYPS